MKAKTLLVLLLAGMLVGCHEDTYNTADRKLFRTFDGIMGQLCFVIEDEYNKAESLDIEGIYLMTEGYIYNCYLLSGDSLRISKISDTEYKLTIDNSAKSALDLIAELTDHLIWERDNKEHYSFVVNGGGSCRISEDSTFIYEITDLGIGLNRYISYDVYTYLCYTNGGEITLNLNANDKKQTYHYTNSGGRIRCRETNNQIRSYDD